MQTSMACKPCRFLAQLPSDSRRFPLASLRETRETPVHFHAKPRHFPRKPPQFSLKAHAVPPLPNVDSHRNAPRTRACASSNSATEPTFSAHQRNARDNKPMQLSTTAIPAHEKGAREPLTLYYLVFVQHLGAHPRNRRELFRRWPLGKPRRLHLGAVLANLRRRRHAHHACAAPL